MRLSYIKHGCKVKDLGYAANHWARYTTGGSCQKGNWVTLAAICTKGKVHSRRCT